MDRSEWLKNQRHRIEENEDRIYAPIYDDNWGTIFPLHEHFMQHFLSLCPPGGHILDAACGTGKYWAMILASGRSVFGIDQSAGMLARAAEKFPLVATEKLGLQELYFLDTFAGAICIDALELVSPEDWPLALGNIQRALMPGGYFYLTVEQADQDEIDRAYHEALQAGLPVVYGECAMEGGYHAEWAQEGYYHFYPPLEQVKSWLQTAGFEVIEEQADKDYHHILVRKK